MPHEDCRRAAHLLVGQPAWGSINQLIKKDETATYIAEKYMAYSEVQHDTIDISANWITWTVEHSSEKNEISAVWS